MPYAELAAPFIFLIVIISIWSAIWKGFALWKSARNSQLPWFIVMLVLNTAGILEILYIFFFQKKKRIAVQKESKKK